MIEGMEGDWREWHAEQNEKLRGILLALIAQWHKQDGFGFDADELMADVEQLVEPARAA